MIGTILLSKENKAAYRFWRLPEGEREVDDLTFECEHGDWRIAEAWFADGEEADDDQLNAMMELNQEKFAEFVDDHISQQLEVRGLDD